MHFESIPKTYCFPGNCHFKKKSIVLECRRLYTEMLTMETNTNVAQWYITGLQKE